MRLGTWNLDGRWTEQHERFLTGLDCDVLLLTEVSERLSLPDHHLHLGRAMMAPRRRWAAVLSRSGLQPLPDPHPASAMAVADGTTYCSSVLPWKGCGSQPPWQGLRHVDRTRAAVTDLLAALPRDGLVWGGDWNHALVGKEYAGGKDGRGYLLAAVEALDLQVPTTYLPHALEGLVSIDHVAVQGSATVEEAQRIGAVHDGRRLSDHDAYVVTVAL